jgi:opacity protein-like surface antigen
MGSMKTLLSAGAIAAGLSVPAFAADMAPLAPPPIFGSGAAPAAVAELGTGWYLRGDIGYGEFRNVKDTPYGVPVPPLDREKIERTWSAGAGIGYQLTSWLRLDGTVDYRNDSNFSATSSRTNYIEGFSTDRAKFESTTFLANGYIDLGNWSGITPYIGAGVGAAQTRLRDYNGQVTCLTTTCGDTSGATYAIGPQPTLSPLPSKTTYTLAWALMAGAAVDIASGVKLDLGYRYVNLGEARTRFDQFGVGTKLKAIDSHEVRLGVRYMID